MKDKSKYVGNYNVLDDNNIEDRSNRTRIVKDRIVPHLKNETAGVAAGVLGAGVGAGLGYGMNKATRSAKKYLMNGELGDKLSKRFGETGKNLADQIGKTQKGKYVLKNLQTPGKILFSNEFRKYRTMAATIGGAAMMAPKFREMGKILDRTKRFEKEHMKSFGTQPNESEYLQAANLNPSKKSHRLAYNLFNTPDAMIKSKRRDISLSGKINRDAKNGEGNDAIVPMYTTTSSQYHMANPYGYVMPSNKQASEILDTIIEKTASFENALNKSKKIVPAITGTLAGSAVGGASAYMTAKGVDDDDKNKTKKVLLGAGAGTLLGAGVGTSLGKNAVGIVDGIYGKVKNPGREFIKEINKFDRMALDAYGDFIPNNIKSKLGRKFNNAK